MNTLTVTKLPIPAVIVGSVLKDARLHKNLTLRELAKESHTALSYISEVERGVKEPSSVILVQLCNALNLPMSKLYTETAKRYIMEEQYARG